MADVSNASSEVSVHPLRRSYFYEFAQWTSDDKGTFRPSGSVQPRSQGLSSLPPLGPVHTYPDIFESATFLSGYENIRVHTLCDHSVFISNSPVHTYSDSLWIH